MRKHCQSRQLELLIALQDAQHVAESINEMKMYLLALVGWPVKVEMLRQGACRVSGIHTIALQALKSTQPSNEACAVLPNAGGQDLAGVTQQGQ